MADDTDTDTDTEAQEARTFYQLVRDVLRRDRG